MYQAYGNFSFALVVIQERLKSCVIWTIMGGGGRFWVSPNSKPILSQLAELVQFYKLALLLQAAHLAQFDKFVSRYM